MILLTIKKQFGMCDIAHFGSEEAFEEYGFELAEQLRENKKKKQ